MRDSASAKVAIVVGIGAVALGLAALRARIAEAPRPPRDPVPAATVTKAEVAVTPEAPPPRAGDPPQELRPRGPTQADRIALLEAASAGDQGKVEALFARGVNLDGTLENAARSGSASLVGWLLAHGVDAKEDEDLSVPPLLVADEHEAVVKLLLAKGAREPTLAKAVAAAAPRAVTRLLAKGASAGSRSAEGEPVLMVAVRDAGGPKRRAIVDALLAAGADPSAKWEDETPLSLAMSQASLAAAAEDKPGDRPQDVVARLVARGAKVDGEALLAALAAEEERRPALLEILLGGTLERSATVRAIAFAAENQDAASIKKLAARGVSWGALDTGTPPPLASAIVASDVPMVRVLLEAGAPTDRMGENGDTALLASVAAAAGESEEAVRVVRVLLERGASPNKRGRDGRTALFAAAQQGSEALVALLASKGARVDDAVDGMTPIEVADGRGFDAVVKVLKGRGARLRRATD